MVSVRMATSLDIYSRCIGLGVALRAQTRRFIDATDGMASLEYGLIASGISAAGIAAMMGMSDSLASKIDAISAALSDMPNRFGSPSH